MTRLRKSTGSGASTKVSARWMNSARWGCALLCELTSSKALVMAFEGYVDTVLERVEPSASLALLVAGFQG